MFRRMMVLAVIAGLVPAAAHAQRASADAEQRIDVALERATSAGVPRSLLENRAAEGRAKGVSEERIAAAVEARLEALLSARAMIGERGERVDATELAAAGAALEAGVSRTALEAVREANPPERRAVAIAVLTELVQRGVASEEALARVELALTRGGEPRERGRGPLNPIGDLTERPDPGPSSSRPDGWDAPSTGSRTTGGVEVGIGIRGGTRTGGGTGDPGTGGRTGDTNSGSGR